MRRHSLYFLVGISALVLASNSDAQNATAQSTALHIDIPTKLDRASVVIDFGHAVYLGDTLFALGDVNLLADDVRAWNSKGEIVVVLHGDAAYLTLNDGAYNANRHVATGNPFKKILDELMEKGVHIELCGATAAANHWSNADLLPGIKVNVNAMVRVTELEQQGYTLIFQ